MKFIIKPQPGYILCKPFVDKGKTFVSAKEQDGYDQKSIVLKVGKPVLDDKGQLRETNVKPNDIIVHVYNNAEFELDNIKYRNVHFTQVHDILEEEK